MDETNPDYWKKRDEELDIMNLDQMTIYTMAQAFYFLLTLLFTPEHIEVQSFRNFELRQAGYAAEYRGGQYDEHTIKEYKAEQKASGNEKSSKSRHEAMKRQREMLGMTTAEDKLAAELGKAVKPPDFFFGEEGGFVNDEEELHRLKGYHMESAAEEQQRRHAWLDENGFKGKSHESTASL